MARINTVADARRLAKRRLPLAVFDYLDGGAGTEGTLRANESAMGEVRFRPNAGNALGDPGPDLATTVLGTPVSMPLLMSPVGFTRSMQTSGDVAGAQAAGAVGTIFTLSSMSGHTIAEVAEAATGPTWFQLYFLGGRAGAEQLVDRAKASGYQALLLTLDTAFPGNRERDLRYKLRPPISLDWKTVVKMAPQVATKPEWLAGVARDGFQLAMANALDLGPADRPMSQADALFTWIFTPARWEDLAWLRNQWSGPIVAKGIITGDDARRAVDCGFDAIIVSNHGGRQLDGVSATLPALVEVKRAVGDAVEVLVDGGIRRGSDVVRAVALGAKAAMAGRAWAYGVAAAGRPGVDRILALLREDMDRTLRLLGCDSVADLTPDHVRIPADW